MFLTRSNALNFAKGINRACKSLSLSKRTNFQTIYRTRIQLSSVQNLSSSSTSTTFIEENVSSSENSSDDLPSELKAFTKGDKDLEHKLKVLMLETDVLRQDGKAVPSLDFIKPEMWEHLLQLSSRSKRIKYLEYLFKTQKKKENALAKKLQKRQKFEEEVAQKNELPKSLPIEEHAQHYGLIHNNIFIRFQDSTMNRLYNSRLIQAMQFGQKLVIDCGYDEHMTRRENYNTAKQLMLLFADNRIHKDPFDLYYLNMNKQSDLEKLFHKYIPTLYERDFPTNVSEKGYLDLFPKEKLVYLTPHCQEEMVDFDHDAIYIIGAIVDKVNQDPLSLAKAKREGLTMKKFPLDRYLSWGAGSGKSLTINQCTAILLDLKVTGDWKYALRHVPRRKLMDTTSVVNKFKTASERKPFSPQNKFQWRPDGGKKRKLFNVTNLYDQ